MPSESTSERNAARLCRSSAHCETQLQKRSLLHKTMPNPNQKKPIPQPRPQQPGEIDVNVDDAQIEEPKDDDFEKGDEGKLPLKER